MEEIILNLYLFMQTMFYDLANSDYESKLCHKIFFYWHNIIGMHVAIFCIGFLGKNHPREYASMKPNKFAKRLFNKKWIRNIRENDFMIRSNQFFQTDNNFRTKMFIKIKRRIL